MKYLALLVFTSLYLIIPSKAQQNVTKINAEDAYRHVGDSVYLEARLVGRDVVDNTSTTRIYVGRNYPNQLLTLVIKAQDRDKFCIGCRMGGVTCIYGKIVNNNGKPEIVLVNSNQLPLCGELH